MPSLFVARQNPLDDARNTFSSWDNCMAKNYCKWPVIVGIVVGSLILISVITCIARCICCGAECACCCFKCCSCCCSGGGGRSSGHKRVKSEPTPTYPTTPYSAPFAQSPYAQTNATAPLPALVDNRPVNQQYRSNPMPTFNPAPAANRPQYATFAAPSKPVNEDALPAMPTWSDGRDVHVEVEDPVVPEKRGDMELDRLNHNGSVSNAPTTGMAAVGGAGARRSPGPGRSPITPTGAASYGFPYDYQTDSFAAAAHPRNNPSPYHRPYAQHDDYRRVSPGPALSPVSGGGNGFAQNQPYGRRPPAQPQPQHYDSYDQQERYDPHTPIAQPDHRDFYDAPSPPQQRYHSPSPPNNFHSSPYPKPHSATNAPYDTYDSAPHPPRTHTPGYAPSESIVYEPSTTTAAAYPGQQTYSAPSAYPGQTTYQAFQPAAQGTGAPAQAPYSGVTRKAVGGSVREI